MSTKINRQGLMAYLKSKQKILASDSEDVCSVARFGEIQILIDAINSEETDAQVQAEAEGFGISLVAFMPDSAPKPETPAKPAEPPPQDEERLGLKKIRERFEKKPQYKVVAILPLKNSLELLSPFGTLCYIELAVNQKSTDFKRDDVVEQINGVYVRIGRAHLDT